MEPDREAMGAAKAAESDFPPGTEVVVEIETPRFGFVKRLSNGGIDFISPIPSLFHYGFVPGSSAADGDPQDAIVLTDRRLVRGERIQAAVAGRVLFVDDGCRDDKLICCADGGHVTLSDRRRLRAFFAVYACLKRGIGFWRGRCGKTVFEGIDVNRNESMHP